MAGPRRTASRNVDIIDLIIRNADNVHRYLESRISKQYRDVVFPEDVRQEVWKEALRKPPERFDDFTRWLIGVAQRKLFDALKKASRERQSVRSTTTYRSSDRSDSFVCPSHTPSREFARSEKIDALVKALALLPTAQRQALYMFYWEGKKREEIAELMESTGPSVMHILSAGRARLGELLAASHGPTVNEDHRK